MRVVFILTLLASCQSSEDRYWSDMQAIIEHTQPKK
jgi:hypothetical protein